MYIELIKPDEVVIEDEHSKLQNMQETPMKQEMQRLKAAPQFDRATFLGRIYHCCCSGLALPRSRHTFSYLGKGLLQHRVGFVLPRLEPKPLIKLQPPRMPSKVATETGDEHSQEYNHFERKRAASSLPHRMMLTGDATGNASLNNREQGAAQCHQE